MNSWEKEIEYDDPLYLRGYITCKYRGNLNHYLTEINNQGDEYINIDSFYDILIKKVTQVEKSLYKSQDKRVRLHPLSSNVEIQFNNELFSVQPDEFFLVNDVVPEHEQQDNDEIHGSLLNQEVIIKVNRKRKKIICIEGAVVSREEIQENKILEKYIINGENCTVAERVLEAPKKKSKPEQTTNVGDNLKDSKKKSFDFIKKVSQTCTSGKRTGKERYVNGLLEYEVYNSDCSTRWIRKQQASCLQDEWTGEEKRVGDWIQRRYYNSDCTTYWKDYKKVESSKYGCLVWAILIFIILGFLIFKEDFLSFILLVIYLILISLIINSFGLIISFVSKYLIKVFSFIFRLGALLLILWLIFNVIDGINHRKSTSEDRRERTERKRGENRTITIEDEAIDESLRMPDSLNIYLSWLSFDEMVYEGNYKLSKNDIINSEDNLRARRRVGVQNISDAYYSAYQFDKNKLKSIYDLLSNIKDENNLERLVFLEVIVSMVQNLDYTLILEQNCDDIYSSGLKELIDMINSGIECKSPHAFGIKTPTEFLATLDGDCDTRTLALYTILKHFDYDVVILNSDAYMHSMLGVNIDGVSGAFKTYRGKKYYFWETTNIDYPIGYLPRNIGNTNNWYVALK